jgi:TolB protein
MPTVEKVTAQGGSVTSPAGRRLLGRVGGVVTVVVGVAWSVVAAGLAVVGWVFAGWIGLAFALVLLALALAVVVLGVRQVRAPRRLGERVAGAAAASVTAIVVGVMVVSALGTEHSTFVTFDTSDATPAWSPSGQTIAFASNRRGGGLYLIARDGTHLRRLTAIGGWNPSWSPDGTRLAFVADDGLYVITAPGGRAQRLLKTTRDLSVDAPAWSPDGEMIAFERELPDLSTAIYTIPADGGKARRLAPPALAENDPGWSSAAVSELHPSWSPDGRRIAYISTVNLTGEVDGPTESVMAMNRDGTGRTRLSDGRTGSYEPAWSPDGSKIAYQCEGSLCVLDLADPGHQHRLTGDAGNPSWSPDSELIVYEHYLYGGTGYFSKPSNLSIIDATGTNEQRLTFGPTHSRPSSATARIQARRGGAT